MERNSSQINSSTRFSKISAILRFPDKLNKLHVSLPWGTVMDLLMPFSVIRRLPFYCQIQLQIQFCSRFGPYSLTGVLHFPLSGGLIQKDEVDVNFQLGCCTGLISRPCSGSGGLPVKDLYKGNSQ